MPEKKDVYVTGDLINLIQPGDNVQITGTYTMVNQTIKSETVFPFYQTMIEANHVSTE